MVAVGINLTSESNKTWLVYLATVGAIMAALKLKESWDEYNSALALEQARAENARRDALGNGGPRIDIDQLSRTRYRRRTSCCICCGIDFGLFWKAVGILLLCIFSKQLLYWKFVKPPTGLEGMPAFGTSLGCQDAPFIYKQSTTKLSIPIEGEGGSHSLEIVGDAVGTVILAQAKPDVTDIQYEMTIRTEDKALLRLLDVKTPKDSGSGADLLRLSTPRNIQACMRYDITLFIPPTLRSLQITSFTKTQVQFDANSDAELDNLSVVLERRNPDNLLLSTSTIRGKKTTLEVNQGWLVGDVAIVEETHLNTKAGGVTNVYIQPTEPKDMDKPEPAILRTTTGTGRTDIFYTSSKVFKRPISSLHTSGKGDLYLQYQKSEFEGKIAFDASDYTTYNVESMTKTSFGVSKTVHHAGEDTAAWTHWKGSKSGADRMRVKSDGWVGLYF